MGRRKFPKSGDNVMHFRLVSRASTDPHADDPDAPPLVLEPFLPPSVARKAGADAERLLTIPKSLEEAVGPAVFGLEPKDGAPPRQRAPRKVDPDDLEGDCYFPNDGYDYEQHLKSISKPGRGGIGVVLDAPQKLAAEVLQQQPPAMTEEEAEVLRALENAEEYEELDVEAIDELLPGGAVDPDVVLWGPTARENDNLPDLAFFKNLTLRGAGADGGDGDDDEEEDDEEDDEDDDEEEEEDAGGRPAGRGRERAPPLLDGKAFDKFLAAEYGDDDIGAYEDEDIEGKVDLDTAEGEALLDEYLDGKKREDAKLYSIYEPKEGKLDDVPRVIEETRAIIAKHYCNEEGSDDEDTSGGEESPDESRTWDCETILSTLSNVSNRPGKIGRIKLVKKPAAQPLKPIQEGQGKAAKEEDEEDEEASDGIIELPDVVTVRPKNETAEERRQRKAGVKEMRRVCRQMKKESKETYKSEATKMAGQQANSDLRARVRCVKL